MRPNNVDIRQHNDEIQQNAKAWARKPLLQKAYSQFYEAIKRHIDPKTGGMIVELGSGLGNIKKHIPDCVITDLFPNPWIDRVESAYNLSFSDNSISHLILFDVWHHLEYPVNALKEAHRVLTSGGTLIIMEPAMSVLGRIVYGKFHHEPLGLELKLNDTSATSEQIQRAGYFAAQGSAHRVFVLKEVPQILNDWDICDLKKITSLSYWATGGFSGPVLCPRFLEPLMVLIDRICSFFPNVFAARLLIVLSKKD
jgi:SAM-dependent methyltransferase